MEKEISINLDISSIDQAIEKANRLLELLREVQVIVDSLFGTKNSEA